MQVFESSVELPVGLEAAFAYHARPGAHQRRNPPWENVVIESADASLAPGSRVTLRTKVAGLPIKWVAEHVAYDPPHRFEDVAISGPFDCWHHQHRFTSLTPLTTKLTDHIDYQLPLGALGRAMASGSVHSRLAAMFAYRHRITRDDLTVRSRYDVPPATIAVTGAGGLVGSELMPFLSVLGHHPIRIHRNGEGADTTFQLGPGDRWEDCDAVVHLAGKSIASQRWSDQVKAEIRDSRVAPTRRLCQQLAALSKPPKVLVCASAVGIYGDRGDELLSEASAPGNDFLSGVASEWEAACEPARQAGIRVVNLRLGLVLSPRGGALASMLMPARLGLGGPLGEGRQWWSWIAIDDVLGIAYHAIFNEEIQGPVNVVAPNAVTNRQFATTLGAVLGRPAFLPAPASALRLALGEMADDLLLTSTRAEPRVACDSGYSFRFSELESALRHLLGQTAEAAGEGANRPD
ncbi:MAG: TIGR01777 family oxidoreductase [Planctomycetaceae bacterium]